MLTCEYLWYIILVTNQINLVTKILLPDNCGGVAMPTNNKRKKITTNLYYDSERKLYYVRFYYGKINGKVNQEWKTFKTKNEALKALKLFELNKADGRNLDPSKQTIAEFIEYWLKYKSTRCEYTTIYGYQNIVYNYIIPHIGKVVLKQLQPHHIIEYMDSVSKEGLSNNTIKKHYDLLKSVMKQAVLEDKVAYNVIDKVEPPKIEKKEMSFYTAEELVILLDIIATKPALDIAVHIAAYTGLRREEILGLKWDCVDFDHSVILIKKAITKAGSQVIEKSPKTKNSYRKISISDYLSEKLMEYKKIQVRNAKLFEKPEYEYIFCKPNGELYHVNYISTLFKNVIEQYNLKPLRFHDLRHTFTSIAQEQGISIFEISKTLGHSTISTTSNIYTHLFDDTHAKTTDAVANKINEVRNKMHSQDQ